MVLDFRIDVPCVVQWRLLWFSAPTNLNRILGHELKIKKYHEVVNGAIMDAIKRQFGGEHTPRSCMLTSVAKVLHRTHNKCGVRKIGKANSDMEPRKPGGSNPREAAGDKAPQTPGSMRNQKGKLKDVSAEYEAIYERKEDHVEQEWQREREKRS